MDERYKKIINMSKEYCDNINIKSQFIPGILMGGQE